MHGPMGNVCLGTSQALYSGTVRLIRIFILNTSSCSLDVKHPNPSRSRLLLQLITNCSHASVEYTRLRLEVLIGVGNKHMGNKGTKWDYMQKARDLVKPSLEAVVELDNIQIAMTLPTLHN